MASTYTTNGGIEKIGTGDQAGTWGTTTNLNLDIIDRLINGVGTVTISGTTHTLTTTDGTLSDGMYKLIIFSGSPSGDNTVTIEPNDQQKILFCKNSTSGGHNVIIKQGSGTTVTVANGKTAIVFANGGGSGADVAVIETSTSSFGENVFVTTGSGGVLTLRSSDTDITANDVLGKLQYRSSADTDGGDAVEVSASIEAIAENTFSATANPTTLEFKTGLDAPATTKLKLTSAGDLNLVTDTKSINFGENSEVSLTHVHNVGLLLNSTRRLYFEDASNLDQYIGSGGSGVLEIASPTEIDLTSATIDVNGNLDVSGSITLGGTAITSTATEINFLDGSSTGTVVASKAVVVDGNKDIASFRHLTATGTITAGSFMYSSDESLKKDIKTIEEPIEKIKQLRGVSYTWNENSTQEGKKDIGLIAQEVEKVLPELVAQSDSMDTKTVNYGHLIGLLIEAVKDQQKQIDELKK
tara:strand:+ start:64 stop:1470 length:1407 start_codon:yes stop_codon:yes gene_type:complete